MEKLKNKMVTSALGAAGALAGAGTVSSCAGGACASCFACAGGGGVLLLAVLFNRVRKARKGEQQDAVA